MSANMASTPATAQASWRNTNEYGEPKRSLAITAEALKTMMRPTNTSSSVTVNKVLSTLTRLAMGKHSAISRQLSACLALVTH
jgi:hypothetical protein